MSKEKKRESIPKEYQDNCHRIIHGTATIVGGIGAGGAQIPLADNLVITPIQIGMIIRLGKVFNQKITKSAARAVLASLWASFIGRAASQLLWGWVPGFGNANNALTAVSLTELIGWTAAARFYKNMLSGDYEPLEMSDENYETQSDEDTKERDPLIIRIEEFLCGEKNTKDHRQEYNILLSEVENELLNRSENDPLHSYWNALANLRFAE